MSSAMLAVGVPIADVITVKVSPLLIRRYNPADGTPFDVEVPEQPNLLVNGMVMPFTVKRFLNAGSSLYSRTEELAEAGYDVSAELSRWVQDSGFSYHLYIFFHERGRTPNPPQGVLGIPVWGYDPDHAYPCDNYGYVGNYEVAREINPTEVETRLKQVEVKLKAIGCEQKPKVFVVHK